MRRSICLGVLTLAGVFATIAVNEARQDRAALAAHTIADNLFMLANAPSVQGMGKLIVTSSGSIKSRSSNSSNL